MGLYDGQFPGVWYNPFLLSLGDLGMVAESAAATLFVTSPFSF